MSTALTIRPILQELADAALDVYTETQRRDPGLIQFHNGENVRILLAATEVPWTEIAPWSLLTASQGFEVSTDQSGGAVEGVILTSVLVWPEPSFFREIGETGSATLDMLYRIAIQGGRNAVGTPSNGNPTLVWDPTWDAPPPGFSGTVNEQTARYGIVRGPLASQHGVVEGSLSDGQPCIINAVKFSAVFGVTRSKC